MLKKRFQEILEFTKSESPYDRANRGWINQDIFLEFGKSSSTLSKQKEAAKVILLWPPIKRLITNLLLMIIISSLIVLTTIKASDFNFNLNSFTDAFKNKIVQLESKKSNFNLEENKIIDLNSDIEEEFKKETNISTEELLSKEDSLKLEDDISKDQILELEEEKLEEIEIKNDMSITTFKKSKSNFF